LRGRQRKKEKATDHHQTSRLGIFAEEIDGGKKGLDRNRTEKRGCLGWGGGGGKKPKKKEGPTTNVLNNSNSWPNLKKVYDWGGKDRKSSNRKRPKIKRIFNWEVVE